MKSIDQINLQIRTHMETKAAGLPSHDSQIRINALSWVRRIVESGQGSIEAIEFRVLELNSVKPKLTKCEFYASVNDIITYVDELKWVLNDEN